MDYEVLLFALKPLVKCDSLDSDSLNDGFFATLDDLAVSLRSYSNREIVGKSGLLSDLIRTLHKTLINFFIESDRNYTWLRLASALIRCIANSIADNDDNRKISIAEDTLFEHSILGELIPEVFKFQDNNNTDLCLALYKHSAAFVKNLFMGNDGYIEKYGAKIQVSLFSLISNLTSYDPQESSIMDMIFELLVDSMEVNSYNGKLQEVNMIAELIVKIPLVLNNLKIPDAVSVGEEEDDDEEAISVGLLLNMTKCIEIIVTENSNSWDPNSYYLIHEIEEKLFMSLEKLNPLNFPNKLIIMRRLTVPFGHLTTIKGYSNSCEQDLCIEMLLKHKKNGYIISCALLVLSNSIMSRKDVDNVSNKLPMKSLIKLAESFDDPIQYQSYLDILKKLLNLSTVILIDNDDLLALCNVLKSCYEKSQFFKQLLPLLSALIQKLLVLLPSAAVHFLLSDENTILQRIITENDCVFSCLALDKLLISGRKAQPSVCQQLWVSAFNLRRDLGSHDEIPPFRLFQLAKSIGIYLKNCETQQVSFDANIMFHQFSEDLRLFLEILLALQHKEDKASKAALNNGKFIAGMLITLLQTQQELSPEVEIIKHICEKMLN